MIQINSDDRVFVTGKTGSGKSYFCKHILWNMGWNIRIMHDPKLEELIPGKSILLKDPNTYAVRSEQELLTALNAGKRSLVYLPQPGGGKDADRESFDKLCQIVYGWGNICLFADEVNMVSDRWGMSEWHREIVLRGRVRNCGIVNCSQRPKEIPSELISESEHQFIFKLQMAKDMSDKMNGLVPDGYEKIMFNLPKYHCIYHGEDGATRVMKPISFRG